MKLENKNAKRKIKFNEAVNKAVVLYKEGKIKNDGLSLTKVLVKIQSLTSFCVPPSTVWDLT